MIPETALEKLLALPEVLEIERIVGQAIELQLQE